MHYEKQAYYLHEHEALELIEAIQQNVNDFFCI